jgi:phage terminase large subunit-like protein
MVSPTPLVQAAPLSQGAPVARLGPHQRAPARTVPTWLVMAGRGSGKTLAGAHWVVRRAEPGARIALVGPTLHDVRSVMVEGASGVLAAMRTRGEGGVWAPSLRQVAFDNGAVVQCFSADEPDSLRGPQFHAAWGDEVGAWPRAGAVLPNLRLGLRLGQRPLLILTTTPRPTPALRALLAEPSVTLVHATSRANRRNLAPDFLVTLDGLYGGSAIARQEIGGEMLADPEGGVVARAAIDAARRASVPPLERVLVAVDPPAGEGAASDACGIVVAGRFEEAGTQHAAILADATVQGLPPAGWARAVMAAAEAWAAGHVVIEANGTGAAAREVLRLADPSVPVRSVNARQSKVDRALPVGALYAAGRVVHVGAFPALEDELAMLGTPALTHSPDRADALVWAVRALLLDPQPRPTVVRL